MDKLKINKGPSSNNEAVVKLAYQRKILIHVTQLHGTEATTNETPLPTGA